MARMILQVTYFVIILLCALFATWFLYRRSKAIERKDIQSILRYGTGNIPTWLFALFGVILAWRFIHAEWKLGFLILSANCLYISIYYAVLLIILPLLRKKLLSGACTFLWAIPIFCIPALIITNTNIFPVLFPPVHIPFTYQGWMLTAWGIGFAVLLLWYLVSHLVLRRRLLRNAGIRNSQRLDLWERTMGELRFTKYVHPPMSSPDAKTPLTVGLFLRSQRVILPEKEYTQEELRLIFRHELMHIKNYDCTVKFFMALLVALFWYNPLMWILLLLCTEDMELNCDEMVLADADEITRHQYAALLLHTAASPFGFTSCLSATGRSLRYRLKNIVNTPKKRSGAIIAGVAIVLFFGFFFFAPLAYDHNSGQNHLFSGGDIQGYQLTAYHIGTSDNYVGEGSDGWRDTVENSMEVYSYLADLSLMRMTRALTKSEAAPRYVLEFAHPDGDITITLIQISQKYTLVALRDRDYSEQLFYCSSPLLWEELESLLP